MLRPELLAELTDQPHSIRLLTIAVPTRRRLPRGLLLRHNSILVSKVRSLQRSQGGSPTSGVSAVAINLTVTEPDAAGYVQAAPAATLTPGASSTINVNTPGQTIAASTIVPVDNQGRIALYSLAPTHLIIDITGYFTDNTAPTATNGMFIPTTNPTRLLDTREPADITNGQRPTAGQRLNINLNASIVNITIADTAAPGYVQLGPSTMTNGATSTINANGPNEIIANTAIIQPGPDNKYGLYTHTPTHVIIDPAGQLTN